MADIKAKRTAAPAAKKGEPLIVQHINIKTINRTNQDIQKWRNAIKAAERVFPPQRSLLYDLYFDLLLDAQLLNTTNTRRRKVTNSTIKFMKDGEEVEAVRDLIESPMFYNLLADLVDTRFWGFTVCEFYLKDGKLEYYMCPRKHIKPESNIITVEPWDTTGIDFTQPPLSNYILAAGSPDDLGLYMAVAQYVIYKRGNFGDWAQFTEVFGMPFRWGKYDGYDENTRLKLDQALANMGSAAYAVLPENASVEIVQNNNNGNGEVYERMNKAADEQISLAILGQTMTTKDGSSLSQAQVHADVADSVYIDDRKFVLNILNHDFKNILNVFGIPTEGEFMFVDESKISLKDRITIDTQSAQQVFLPENHWFETYGIDKPDDYEAQKAAHEEKKAKAQAEAQEKAQQQLQGASPFQKGESKGDLKANQPNKQQQGASPFKKGEPKGDLKRVAMRARYNPAPVATFNIPFIAASKNTMPRKDWLKLQAEAKRLAQLIYDGLLPDDYYVSDEMVQLVAEHLKKAIAAGFGTSFTTGDNVSDLVRNLQGNIYKFSAAKNYNMLRDMNALLVNADGTMKTLSKFNQAIDELNITYNRNWQATEYNTAQASSQMASKWEQFQREADDVPLLRWVTVGDDRVRDTHRALDGITLPADDPFWSKFWPPIDWNDRCDVIQVASGKVVKPVETPPVTKGFEGNPGQSGEIFSENHPYFKGVPAEVAEKIFSK
jgi:SPP1 gp7 family putative phage head morphogenesis protein